MPAYALYFIGVIRVFPVAALMMLSGCVVGPDYHKPVPGTPGHYSSIRPHSSSLSEARGVDPQWWETFNDSQLNSLVNRAIKGNLSLQQIVLRIAASRQQLKQADAAWFPTLNGNLQYSREQLGIKGELESQGIYRQLNNSSESVRSALDSLTRPVNLWQGSFDASWELDLWGKVRRQTEMAEAQLQQSVENRHDALVSLEAEVARTWLQLRGDQALAATVETQQAVARQTLELTQSQQRHGLAAQTDVENARAQLHSLQALLPQYQSQARQAMNGLAVLLGQFPGALNRELSYIRPLPALPAQVAVGIPSAVVRRRPDIRVAEARLHAATANIGVAVAQLFPALTLNGTFGMRNTDISYLDEWSSHFYSTGPGLIIPIFQGGRLIASVRLARVEQVSTALGYRQAVLMAFQDVENALVSYQADKQRVGALAAQVTAQQHAFMLARDSYRQGISAFIEALDAERQLVQAQQQLATAQMDSSIDLVALYKALGGGWQPFQRVVLPELPLLDD